MDFFPSVSTFSMEIRFFFAVSLFWALWPPFTYSQTYYAWTWPPTMQHKQTSVSHNWLNYIHSSIDGRSSWLSTPSDTVASLFQAFWFISTPREPSIWNDVVSVIDQNHSLCAKCIGPTKMRFFKFQIFNFTLTQFARNSFSVSFPLHLHLHL